MLQSGGVLVDRRKKQNPMKTPPGLMLDTEHAVWAHIGDSETLSLSRRKACLSDRITARPRSLCCWAEIAPSQIRSSKDRAILTKALGQPGDVPAAQIHAQLLEPGVHAFLLCTDGFWEYVLEEEMEQGSPVACAAQSNGWRKMRRRLQARPRPIRIIILQL